MNIKLFRLLALCVVSVLSIAHSYALTISDSEINSAWKLPLGKRIAYWAESFVGMPYDTDPLGEYVRRDVIVYDDRVDCMYHVFRSVELALSHNSEEAISAALDKRFITRGMLDSNGKVINYQDRFQYGEDMIDSGKWGREITSNLGTVVKIKGSRGRDFVSIIPKDNIDMDVVRKLKSGDIVFFVKQPDRRVVGEIVGHIGIIKKDSEGVYLIHASGIKGKNKSGMVTEVSFVDYIRSMGFAGIRVTRFEQ